MHFRTFAPVDEAASSHQQSGTLKRRSVSSVKNDRGYLLYPG